MPKSKSCKKGYSRNKSTGRCRKIRKSVKRVRGNVDPRNI